MDEYRKYFAAVIGNGFVEADKTVALSNIDISLRRIASALEDIANTKKGNNENGN